MVTTFEPTVAERVRTVFARAGSAFLAADGTPATACSVRHLLLDGSFALSVEGDAGIAGAAAGTPAFLELIDHAELPLGDPVRSLVWVGGRLRQVPEGDVAALVDTIAAEHPDPALLDVGHGHLLLLLDIDSVVVADATGAEPVEVAELLTARPDPFSLVEPAWLEHLQTHHPEMVARLGHSLPGWTRRGQRIAIVGLDKYGVRMRVELSDSYRDVRLPFAAPVTDQVSLSKALKVLAECPRPNRFSPSDGGLG